MNLAIILVHNKTDAENEAQIETLKSITEEKIEVVSELNRETREVTFHEVPYYTLASSVGDTKVHLYQIVPFGIAYPKNSNDLRSVSVYYGENDQDKVGDHPRFFNWGIQRATNNGAQIIVYITDHKQLDLISLQDALDAFTQKDYQDASFGVVTSNEIQQKFGQLDETKTFNTAIVELKERI